MDMVCDCPQVNGQSVNEIVRSHARLVKRIAHQWLGRLPPAVQPDDLVQAGLAALLQAARVYDPDQGAAFETYATIRIKGAMLDEVRRSDWAPRSAHRNARKVARAVAVLRQSTEREPRDEEVASFLGLSVEEYRRILEAVHRCRILSLDGDAGGEPLVSSPLSDQSTEPSEQLHAEELARSIAENLKKLPEQERVVVSLYYCDDLRFREIGIALGVTESRVCQIHRQAVDRLRAAMGEWKEGKHAQTTRKRTRETLHTSAALRA